MIDKEEDNLEEVMGELETTSPSRCSDAITSPRS